MSMDKDDFEKLDKRLKSIIEESVDVINENTDLPPTLDQLRDNNKTYLIRAAVLFIDIRRSTILTDNCQTNNMVKIYRLFMRMAVDCVRKNGGVTRQFSGDRIMGVFIDSTDSDSGEIIENAANMAINAARSLQTAVDYSLNKYLYSKLNGEMIECGIGIDYGEILVTQVGMYGVEKDPNKEDEIDCVWVGKATNTASKYADIASGGEIFISNEIYYQMAEEHKKVFNESAKYKEARLFKGYTAHDYYVDFSSTLGRVYKTVEDNANDQETFEQLAEGVKEIERLQKDLITRERELVIFEEKLRHENDALNNSLAEEKKLRIKDNNDKKIIQDQLAIMIEDTYSFVKEIIHGSYCRNYDYIENIGIEEWLKIDKFYHELGEMQGYGKDMINNSSFEFIEIYAYFNYYDRAYEHMVSMAKENTIWVYINNETFKWACNQNIGFKVIDAMVENLQNNRIPYNQIKDYEEKIEILKGLRGF